MYLSWRTSVHGAGVKEGGGHLTDIYLPVGATPPYGGNEIRVSSCPEPFSGHRYYCIDDDHPTV